MKLDLSPIREAGSTLREAIAKEPFSEDFRHIFHAYMDATDENFRIHSVTPTESGNLWWSGVHSPRLFAGVAG